MERKKFDEIYGLPPEPLGFWKNMGYTIRETITECANQNTDGLLITVFGCVAITIVTFSFLAFNIIDELNVVEEVQARNKSIEALMNRGINPALAQCIIDENYGDVCKALRTNELKPYPSQ